MKKVIVVGGPTASGKTELAIRIALRYGCEILSADSRQFYREMNIGTAKPSTEELHSVRHHFINSLSVRESYDVNRFETEAMEFLNTYFINHEMIVVVGGSGLYIDALVHGLDPLPERNETIRMALEHELKDKGIIALQDKIRSLDPVTAQTIDMMNPSRLIRAIEICLISGKPASQQRSGTKMKRPFEFHLTAVSPERDTLYERINQRVDRMIQNGLVAEVESLLPYRQLQALHTVGYTELFDFFDGNSSLDNAIDAIKKHTRNYAKRQMTWFRNQNNYRWFKPEELDGIFNYLETSGLT